MKKWKNILVIYMRKYRHEIKYTISKEYAEILKQRLSLLMDVDKNGQNGI